ncbi:hypothetical protein SIN8267_02835 [Sinobacterium norvegicum]|uniref:Uncharacterized protein n=1 Tax=Sinobacterium norvegicum TaxID=1641715 RepID=A0ABM9AI36_9GAMM|nr:zinc ribbon domain-containing protein [Sinobacterium norvegicum]CAH0992702.1 hypothetical protein SIN8267_02835 [Sinobacterium norvegicum]
MAERRFNLLFSGQILSDFDVATVKQNLVSQLKLTDERVEKLFSGRLLTIKKNMAEADALRFQALFANAGAKALLKEVAAEAAEVPVATEQETAEPAAVEPVAVEAPVVKAEVTSAPETVVDAEESEEPAVVNNAQPETTSADTQPVAGSVDCPRCGHNQSAGENNCNHCKMDMRAHLLRLKKRQRIKQKLSA